MLKFFILTGISAFITMAIVRVLKVNMLNRDWSYPLLLTSFPLFYLLFALLINDKSELKNEIFFALIFFAIAIVYVSYRKLWVEYLLATGFFLHAIYDFFHEVFFLNMGVPIWWPEFCAVVNLFIGVYLLFLIKTKQYLREI